jgi:hypothetical protein
MSQNPLLLPTTGTVSGLTMTQDTNAAIDTLNTLASGTAAPSSPEAGQLWHNTTNNTIYIYSLDSTTWIPLFVLNESAYTARPYAEGAFGQCQFQYTSTSVCTLMPFKGNAVSFPNGTVARVSSSGITTSVSSCYLNGTAASALTSGTLYYAYLWNQGTLGSPNYVIDWSTTAYATDTTTGIKIKNGDATRVLVGMAQPVSGPAFSATSQINFVRSAFNDPGMNLQGTFSTARTTTSTSAVEINTEIRCQFLKWAGESALGSITGVVNKSTTSGSITTQPAWDGSVAGVATTGQSYTANALFPVSCSDSLAGSALGEGVHYLTLVGLNNSAGTATYSGGTAAQVFIPPTAGH